MVAPTVELVALDGDGAVRLAGAHRELAAGKGRDIAAVQVIHDVQTVLLTQQALLDQDRAVQIAGARLSENRARQLLLDEVVSRRQIVRALDMHDADAEALPQRGLITSGNAISRRSRAVRASRTVR